MNTADLHVKSVVLEACLAAAWTDGKMSTEEHRYLSHLIESLADGEEERVALRNLRFVERSEEHVHSKIAELSLREKSYVLDTCLKILASDKVLNAHELRFLEVLRKTCNIDRRSYRRKLSNVRKRARARVALNGSVPALIAVILTLSTAIAVVYANLREVDIALTENTNGEEVIVTILEPDAVENPELDSAEEVFEHVRESIVLVNVFIGNDPVCRGSGSVIGKDETGVVYVVTNRHVIHNSLNKRGRPGDIVHVEVQQISGAKFDAELDFYSREHDIALLAVQGMEPYAKPIKLILKHNLRVGQPVYAIGTPLGLKHTFTAGVVSALRESYLQTDATIASGSSGGPIVDRHGALSAIATKGYSAKNYSFAIYADTVLDILEERRDRIVATHRQEESE